MHRCAVARPERHSRRAAGRIFLATLTATLLVASLPADAQALMRRFPRNALRGEIAFGAYPDVTVNGQLTRLAPSAHVRDATNVQPIFGSLVGGKFIVNYTANTMGLVQDVWILRPDEIARLWPRTLQEMQTWGFDEQAQLWVKP